MPAIERSVDYRDLRDQLPRLEALLPQSTLETQLPKKTSTAGCATAKRSTPRPSRTTNPTASASCVALSPAPCSPEIAGALPPAWPHRTSVRGCRRRYNGRPRRHPHRLATGIGPPPDPDQQSDEGNAQQGTDEGYEGSERRVPSGFAIPRTRQFSSAQHRRAVARP
jgi:hypothetical protein